MFHIPYTNLENIEQSKESMEQFKEDFKETFGVPYRQNETSKEDNEYYCGLCECLMPISHFPH